MAAMEATVVATAMPTVVSDLHGLELYGWVGSIYMLATTLTIPVWGKLADTIGRRSIMLAGMAVFLAGSMASGFAWSMTSLVAFRAVQGAGAGALQPVGLTIVGDIFTLEERSKIQGLFGAVWGLAGMIGPLAGGLIVHTLSWRWIFFVNIPFGLAAAALLSLYFHESPRASHEGSELDWLGGGLLCVSIVSLLMGAGGQAPFLTLPLAALTLVLFIRTELRAPAPLVPLSLFSIRVIAIASVCGTLMGAVMMGALMYVPLFVQAVRGGTATQAGAAVAPMLIGWPIASALSGRILPRIGYRPLVRGGLTIVGAATVALWWALTHDLGPNVVRVVMLVFGAGMGFANTALLIAVQESVEWNRRGVATASSMFFRTIGGAIATGALGVLLAHAVGTDIPADVLTNLLSPERGHGLSPSVLQGFASSIRTGMLPIFGVVAVLGVFATAAGWMFPKVEIKKR
jgi:EmrB/QacA subfamily drug resistance transporter